MTYSNHHILVSGSWAGRTLTPTGDGGLSLHQPANGMILERATRLQFDGVFVGESEGATTFEWAVFLESAVTHTIAEQNIRPVWVPVTPASRGVQVDGGTVEADRIVLATQATPAGTPFLITIPEWVGSRLRLRSRITHTGPSPRIRFALGLTEWGN